MKVFHIAHTGHRLGKHLSMDVWSEAGKQALYGIVTVFAILLLLIGLMRLSSVIVARIERIRSRPSVKHESKSSRSGE